MQVNLSPQLESLRSEHELIVANELIKNASSHKDSSDGFGVLGYEADDMGNPVHEFQRIDCRHVEGLNAKAETLRETAQLIVPEIEFLIEDTKTNRKDVLNHFVDRLEVDGKIKVPTNHENVIGVMVIGGIVMCSLYELNLLSHEDVKTALFVSDMIKFTNFREFGPTVDILAGLVSDTLFTQPPSESVKNSHIADEVQDQVNPSTLEIHKELEDSDTPVITFLAASGQRDKKKSRRFGKNKQPKTINMGPLSYGTERMLSTSWLLPAGINMGTKTPSLFIGEMTEPPTQPLSTHSVMNTIAHGLTEATGIKHLYHSKRADFKYN